MIKKINERAEDIVLIANHFTTEFAELKTSEKHLHLKKLKKITETLKIFIDESPLSYLISEKDLIKKNVSKKKIEYSLIEINNESKKLKKILLEAAKFLDNENFKSKKPSNNPALLSAKPVANNPGIKKSQPRVQ